MKPALVLQHLDDGGPGLFAEYAEGAGMPVQVLRHDLGEPLPEHDRLVDYSVLCICGGTQGVNDPDPWIDREVELVKAAAGINLPVVGHCLGGQMISKALGGEVHSGAVTEFGWQRLVAADNPTARAWLGHDGGPFEAMQWHNDVCTLPPGAAPLLEGEHWRNQAFVAGNMLAMQFHIELTAALINHWTVKLRHLVPPPSASVQSVEEVTEQTPRNLEISRRLAFRLYRTCLAGTLQTSV